MSGCFASKSSLSITMMVDLRTSRTGMIEPRSFEDEAVIGLHFVNFAFRDINRSPSRWSSLGCWKFRRAECVVLRTLVSKITDDITTWAIGGIFFLVLRYSLWLQDPSRNEGWRKSSHR